MHPLELEKKLRLPDPAETMETIWKLLKRTRQRIDTSTSATSASISSSPDIALERKRARMEADRRKNQGTLYTQWRTVR